MSDRTAEEIREWAMRDPLLAAILEAAEQGGARASLEIRAKFMTAPYIQPAQPWR